MKKRLIVGNWKMNPDSLEEAKEIVNTVKRGIKSIKKTSVVVCPPYVYLSVFSKSLKSPLFLGAQDVHEEPRGSFTGEVSFMEVSQLGVDFVIVGHSERRKMGETAELVNKKLKSVINSGMTAIVCLGESQRDHNGDYLGFLKEEIITLFKDVSKKLLGQVVVAYEPVWAIGAKEAMSAGDLLETSIFIKKVLKDLYGVYSDDIRILYGGSVDRVNADVLVRDGGVSGLLIGRESLRPKDFVEIIKLVDAI